MAHGFTNNICEPGVIAAIMLLLRRTLVHLYRYSAL